MKDESEPAKRVNAPEPLVRAADREIYLSEKLHVFRTNKGLKANP